MFFRLLVSKKYPELNSARLLVALYSFGFLYGTKNHLVDIQQDGFLGYTYVPWPINLYWTLLTFADPLTVFLLLSFPLWGLKLAVLIMASDILINSSVTFYFYQQTGIWGDGRLGLQVAFGIFVFTTYPYLRRKIIELTNKERSF